MLHSEKKRFPTLHPPAQSATSALHPGTSRLSITLSPVFSNIFIFHGTAYTSFHCHMDTDHFCQPLEFAENSSRQAPLEKGLYLDYSVCIPAGSDLLNP